MDHFLVIVLIFTTVLCSGSETDTTFREIPNKRVTSVMSTTTARTFTECCVKCMKTDGCQAVSVSQATNYVMCNLSDSTDTEDDLGSSVYTGSVPVPLPDYTVMPQKDCFTSTDFGPINADPSTDHQVCKDHCTNHGACGGFELVMSYCYFKGLDCGERIEDSCCYTLYFRN